MVFVFVGILVLVAVLFFLMDKSSKNIPIDISDVSDISSLVDIPDVTLVSYCSPKDKVIYISADYQAQFIEKHQVEIQNSLWVFEIDGENLKFNVEDITKLDYNTPLKVDDRFELEGMICHIFVDKGRCANIDKVEGGFSYSMLTPEGGIAWCENSEDGDKCKFVVKNYTGLVWNVPDCPNNIQPQQATKTVRVCVDDRN